MGQMTPDGVTEQANRAQEQNPDISIDALPQAFLGDVTEFFSALENAAQDDPGATEAVNALIQEIQQTTGLFTDNPDMQAQASSRMEQLNNAIQDSNMPEEIISSFNNIYTASVDSPHFLNVLNGFIQQGGGSISGIAGAAQRLDAEGQTRRERENNSASAAATANMVYDIQANIQNSLDDFFNKNREAIAEAARAAVATEEALGAEAAARQFVDDLSPLQIEALERFMEENPEATHPEIMQFIDGMAEGNGEQLSAAGASAEAAGLSVEMTREGLTDRLAQLDRDRASYEQDGIDFTLNSRDYATDIMAYLRRE